MTLRRWDAATAAVLALLAMTVALTFRDYGISWDEEVHLPYGRMLLSYYTSGFRDDAAFSFINLYMYGGFFDLAATLLHKMLPFGEYETRHLLGGALFLFGLAGGWRLTRLLAEPRAAFIATLCLATTPLLYGHSFINPKDAPFAWFAVWVAYYVCRALGEEGRASRETIAGLGISLGLALGSRILALGLIAEMALIVLFALWVRHGVRGLSTAHAWRAARPFVISLPFALALMALFWPWSVQSPLNIPAALQAFGHSYWHPEMLWNGQVVKADDLPGGYVAVLLAHQLPEYILLGLMAVAVAFLARARTWTRAALAAPRAWQYLFVTLAGLAPVIAFMVLRPTTYNGIRHFLFVVPFLVILAAIGLDQVLEAATRRSRPIGIIAGGLLAILLGRQVVVMADLHPHQYLAFNAVAGGVAGAYGRFDLDYWGESYAEAVRGLTAYVADERHTAGPSRKLRLFVCGSNTSAGYFLPSPLDITDTPKDADFILGGDISNPKCLRLNLPAHRTVVTVTRRGALLSYVLDLRGNGIPPPDGG